MEIKHVEPLIQIIPYGPDAEGFVHSGWLKSFKESDYARRINRRTYFQGERKIVNKLVKEDRTILITPNDNPDQFQAFMNFQLYKDTNLVVINYIFVKGLYRRMGYATKLIKALLTESGIHSPTLVTTYDTYEFKTLRQRFKFTYNPYLVRGIQP